MNISKIVSGLIEAAKVLGLGDLDINNSIGLLENREYGLAFDTVITQLYEYEIEIDRDFYDLIVKVAQKMGIEEGAYSFMIEMVRSENIVPKSVKDKLAEILTLLESND